MNRLIVCEGRDDFVFTKEFLRVHLGMTEKKESPYWLFDERSPWSPAKLILGQVEVILATPKEGGKENLLVALPGILRLALDDGPGRLGIVVDPDDQSDEDLAKSVESRLRRVLPAWQRDKMAFQAEPNSMNFRVLIIPISDGSTEIGLNRNPRRLEQVLVKAVLESRSDLVYPLTEFLRALEKVGVETSPKVARAALMAAIDPATVSGFIASVVGGAATKGALARALESRSIAGAFRKIVSE